MSFGTDVSLSIIFQFVFVLLWLAVVLAIAAIVKQFGTTEQVRKAVHIGTGNILPIVWVLDFPRWFCLTMGGIFCLLALVSYHWPIFPVINSVGRRTYGVFFYAMSITVLVAWFWTIGRPEFAVLGVLVMTWGDGIAALVGQRWGMHPYQIWGNRKSWEGSLAMFLTSYGVSTLVLGISDGWQGLVGLITLPIAGIATLLEAISPAGSDNLSVPIVSAALGYAMVSYFAGA